MKKYKLLFNISIVLVVAFLIQGCSSTPQKSTVSSNINKTQSQKTVSNADNENTILSYDKFEKIFKDVCDKFTVAGFTKSGATQPGSIVVVEKKSSFGKRQFLTLDGSQSSPETQETVSYDENDSKYELFLDFIYLNKDIGNDLVYSNGHFIQKYNKDNIASKYDDCILSFHNILIHATLISECANSAASTTILTKASMDLPDFLKKYE